MRTEYKLITTPYILRYCKKQNYHDRFMEGNFLEIGVLRLENRPNVMKGAWYQRNIRDFVDGTATVYNITGPHDIDGEIHYIQLDNGERWVIMGESFKGPKWIWQQTKERLRMSVIPKGDNYAFDLPIPTPGNRNKDTYTMSCASLEELEGILPDFSSILMENGVTKLGQRMELFDDTSSRKRFLSAIIEQSEGLAPIIGFCITRLLAIIKIYDELRDEGDVEFTHMVDERSANIKKSDGIADVIAAGETAYVEFKPAIWYDYGRAVNDPNYKIKKEENVSDNIVRTVAGFLNAEGGTLFIGVSDDGDAYGLEGDIKLTGRKDLDGLENELNQLISSSVSKEISAAKIRISLPKFQGQTIAKVEVAKANSPVFMQTSRLQNKFYVRIGNATNTMSVESAFNYISQHDWSS